MKKLVFLLIFGLISVANAESVCKEEEDSYYIYGFSGLVELIDKDYQSAKNKKTMDKIKAAWSKLLLRHYMGEIKSSDKESLCLSMYTVKTDYLKTTLTPQDIERFEKFLIGYNGYESYEKNKDNYLNALKFLKHFNKMEYWYSKLKGYKIEDYTSYDYVGHLVDRVKRMTNYNDNPEVFAERFVYGKSLGNPFKFQEMYNDYWLNGMKYIPNLFRKDGKKYCLEDAMSLNCYETKELKYVIQWAESKLKEAKK